MKCLFLLLWAVASIGHARDWFVATNGTGNGSITNPWSLQTALTNHATIQPGDTVWLRGGTYFPTTTWPTWNVNVLGWKPTIRGTNNNLIMLRSYTNEWASIDRLWDLKNGGAAYLRFRDLEFYDSLKGYNLTNAGALDGPWAQFGTGIGMGFEWINCVIHDIEGCTGGPWANSIRGCIIWHSGWNAYDHLCYPAANNFSGNIVGWEFNDTIEHSSSNCVVQNNIIFGAGDNIGGGSRDALFDGGGQLVSNYFYNRFDFIPSNGYPQTLSYISGSPLVVSNNVIVGPTPVYYNETISNNFTSTFYGNIVYANNTNYPAPVIGWFGDAGPAVFDYNHYFSAAGVSFDYENIYHTSLAQWQTYNPTFDVHSIASNSLAPPDMVYVIPNQDQAKRCNIAVYNFSHNDNMVVSLTGVLNSGDSYQLYSAQDYNAGTIQTGIYNGTSISVPMTNLTTAPVLYGTNMNKEGITITQPYPLSPEFGAFVVIGSTQVPLPPNKFRVLSSP
jgi:hypothetical protein